MARACTVCAHPQRESIEIALIQRVANRDIARQFGLSNHAVGRHKEAHLPQVVAQSRQGKREPSIATPQSRFEPSSVFAAAVVAEDQRVPNVKAEIDRLFLRVNKLFDACDAWLTDPRNPDRYDIGPRASDVDVIYEITDEDGNLTERKHARLSWLCNALERKASGEDIRLRIRETETKFADPRKLLLDTTAQLKGQLEFLVDAMERTHNVQQVEQFMEVVLNTVGEADEPTKQRVIERLQSLRATGHASR